MICLLSRRPRFSYFCGAYVLFTYAARVLSHFRQICVLSRRVRFAYFRGAQGFLTFAAPKVFWFSLRVRFRIVAPRKLFFFSRRAVFSYFRGA